MCTVEHFSVITVPPSEIDDDTKDPDSDRWRDAAVQRQLLIV